MKKEKSPSHILLIILIVISVILMSNMIRQLEGTLIKKTNEIETLKMELDITNDKLKNVEIIYNIKDNKTEWKKFFITGYTPGSGEQGTNFTVASMFNLKLERVRNLPIIAVDPEVIPLYSIVEIEGLGVFIALDTGGLIKGNRIDVLCQDVETAYEITRDYLVRILKKGITLTN